MEVKPARGNGVSWGTNRRVPGGAFITINGKPCKHKIKPKSLIPNTKFAWNNGNAIDSSYCLSSISSTDAQLQIPGCNHTPVCEAESCKKWGSEYLKLKTLSLLGQGLGHSIAIPVLSTSWHRASFHQTSVDCVNEWMNEWQPSLEDP